MKCLLQSLRILVPRHVKLESKSVTTMFFENLLPILKKHANIHIIWLVYQPNRINPSQRKSDDETIIDIRDYKNAVEVIQKEKPDLIYADSSWNFIDYALSSAAKFFNIPVFCMVYSDIVIQKNKKDIFKSNISRFFQKSVPTDTEIDTKKFMKRGRFYIYKYLFLLKTKFAIKSERIHTILKLWKFIFSDTNSNVFANDTIQFLENEDLLNKRLNLGFNKSNLIVTGNPIYDMHFHKITNQKNTDTKNNIIRVLFVPSTLYEHGFWTRDQRDFAVKETVRQITNSGKNMALTVKIHPSSSILSDYESLVHSIDSSVPVYQKGFIQDLLNDFDIILTFQSSTTEVYAMLANKPIVLCNYFDLQGDVFLDRDLVINCTDPSSLTTCIITALSFNSVSVQKRDSFIKEFMFKWDGRAGERISSKLLELFEKKMLNQ